MRVRQISIELNAQDLNEMLDEFVPDAKIRVLDIHEDGIRGQLKLLLWNIDFVARPMSQSPDELSLDITASKLVPIPSALVQRQLKEAMRTAPSGIDVIQQAIKVHIPSILSPFGVSLSIRELKPYDGFLRLGLNDVRVPKFSQILGQRPRTSTGPASSSVQRPTTPVT
ncbi:hypothetical protein LLE49_24095 [Alicyclobacillus tolerans]|uniref:hypothetical protein n=1 Tax=Alicyclobacillus tolerans TaxID=90970 RepID=UPI001F24366F|nr:hypothetical protein [Alicyclobacillus tolerans]MCF8567808.1 hypothetical protein [Alicyclobacillus tolerans]